MEKISCWKTSDGKVFENEKEAKDHELTEEFYRFIYDQCHSEMDGVEIADMIRNHRVKIMDFLLQMASP